MTNSKHIRDLYPEARAIRPEARADEPETRTSWWGVFFLFLIMCAGLSALCFWIGPWLMEKYPFFVMSFFAAGILVIAAAVFVKLALSVLAVLSGGR